MGTPMSAALAGSLISNHQWRDTPRSSSVQQSHHLLNPRRGQLLSEALRNAREAIEAYLESLRANDEPIPPPIAEEIVDVAV